MDTIAANIARSNTPTGPRSPVSTRPRSRVSTRPRAPSPARIVKDGNIADPTPDFESFYLQQYSKMVRLAYALVDTIAQAEEVTQDAFAAVYERWSRIDHPAAYLRVTVINRCRRVQRRRMWWRTRPAQRHDDDNDLVFNHVIDATRRLPRRQQAIIALRYDLQLTDSEIASTLGLPIGTVKSSLHRALAALRQEIEK